MRRATFGLLAAALLSVPAFAESDPIVLDPAAAAEPAPELIRLDHQLTKIQEAEERGRIAPERRAEVLVRFRADLDAAKVEAAPSAVNTALHARILARLGEFKRAAGALGEALKQDPENPALRTALSQVRFDQENYPAALAEANTALDLDPDNKEALALKHFSEGRAAMNREAAEDHAPPPLPRESFARRFHFVAADPSTLPFKLQGKMRPAAAPPARIARGAAPAAPGPLPLLPLAEAAALGVAAFEVSRRRSTYVSAEGLDEAHPKPIGRYQRLFAGAILAGVLGGIVYLVGAAVVSAAPLALIYATNAGNHGLRLANSEVGAINPGGFKAVNEIPRVLARVIPLKDGIRVSGMIGAFGQQSAFVTAAEDIAETPAAQLSERLGIESASRYAIIRFPAPPQYIASRIAYYNNPLFIGRGLTSGGAREFQIPNMAIPVGATVEIVEVGK